MKRIAVDSRMLVVASVLWAAVSLGCGGSSYSSPTGPSTPAAGGGGGGTAAADVVITVNGMEGGLSFSPANASVKVGQTVAWMNADAIGHSIAQTGVAYGAGFGTGTILPGTTSSPIKMQGAATMPYHCSIHPSMTGLLTVQ